MSSLLSFSLEPSRYRSFLINGSRRKRKRYRHVIRAISIVYQIISMRSLVKNNRNKKKPHAGCLVNDGRLLLCCWKVVIKINRKDPWPPSNNRKIAGYDRFPDLLDELLSIIFSCELVYRSDTRIDSISRNCFSISCFLIRVTHYLPPVSFTRHALTADRQFLGATPTFFFLFQFSTSNFFFFSRKLEKRRMLTARTSFSFLLPLPGSSCLSSLQQNLCQLDPASGREKEGQRNRA